MCVLLLYLYEQRFEKGAGDEVGGKAHPIYGDVQAATATTGLFGGILGIVASWEGRSKTGSWRWRGVSQTFIQKTRSYPVEQR